MSAPETVVCWKWSRRGYRSTFGPKTVNTLRRMVARHYDRPHRFVCVTDDPSGLDPQVDVIPLWSEWADVQSPHGADYPSCYRRLRAFAPDAEALFGRRFVSLDLDCVITGDLVPLWDRSEDFVIWGDTNPRNVYNGSMFLLTAGSRPHVWTQFDPSTSPREHFRAGCFGSDQGWISYALGPDEPRWKQADGVYSYRNEIVKKHKGMLPPDARVVFFHGPTDPWDTNGQRIPWVREHYR